MGDQLPYYIKGKKKYPRVTSVIGVLNDPGIDSFKKSVDDDKFKEIIDHAIERGKQFHDIVKRYSEGGINDITLKGIKAGRPELYEPTKFFIEWADAKIDKILVGEKTMFNDKHIYAGTPDFIAIYKNRKQATLFDVKFKAVLSFKENLQTAGYVPMAETYLDIKIGDREILQFKKKDKVNKLGKMKITTFKEQSTDYVHFLYCLALYKKINPKWAK